MIRHLPEGVVPFADCGYGRTPAIPFTRQDVLLGCLCDSGVPTLETEGILLYPDPVSREEYLWRFTLPAFSSACSFRYRFVCGEEQTAWFSVDVLQKETISSPVEVGCGWVRLNDRTYLNFQCTDACVTAALDDHPEACSLSLPEPWRLELGGEGIWRLTFGQETRAVCREMTLGKCADGTALWQETVIQGTHHHVWGTGERFDSVDQEGRGSCGQVVEHFTQQGAWTYMPIPFLMTDAGFGYYRATGCNVAMRFQDGIHISSPVLPHQKDYWLLGQPKEQLREYIRQTGQPVLPPEWTFGLWISANGWQNDRDVDEQLEALQRYHCPASVMVLEAWSDENTFYRWSKAWKNPEAMVRRVRDAGLHLILWQIPVIKALKDCSDPEEVRRDRETAVSEGWMIRHLDGTPYEIPERWFEGGLLPDFTNPEACRWWFSKRDHLLDAGVEGFKTDGGEFLYGSDIVLWDGTNGQEAHNAYPMQYLRAYQEWMTNRGVSAVIFSRAGYIGAQTVPIHWAGDQVSTWDELGAQLRAGISAGLSGILFWGFDIGGFAGELPEAELYLRATAFACFCPVMQWHAEPRSGQFYATHDQAFNNDRSPWNLAEKLHAPQIIDIACAFARLREQLRPYLWSEAQFCAAHGRPLMAHLCLDYPEDAQAMACEDEYMLGRSLLVAPIVEKGAEGRMVYLPKGTWRHYFSKEVVQGPAARYVSCSVQEALVYEKVGE